jgi:hypothetical protein
MMALPVRRSRTSPDQWWAATHLPTTVVITFVYGAGVCGGPPVAVRSTDGRHRVPGAQWATDR